MADTKGQVDWETLTRDIGEDMDNLYARSEDEALQTALRKYFEPLVKAAEQACKTLQIYEDYDARALRAALDGLPKVGG